LLLEDELRLEDEDLRAEEVERDGEDEWYEGLEV